ncbi:MAG: ABC transporter permease [Gaiella sp.]|uniref:ABC transporter permease n=1 Tax=Gaiella sp. TaxID=2663207 RepID=UPI003C763911
MPPTQPFGQPSAPSPEEGGESFASRIALAQRAGGAVAPLLTVLLAFVMGGVVVLITTGKNPINTYRAIFDGSGLIWFFQIPWDTGSDAAFNLQQTLILTTTLILVGLAVAFAFRCGLFNIGGQGQYLAGAIIAVWVGSSFESMSPIPHVVLVLLVGTLAGALLAGIAGFLKATVGAHEVITTIMLNWVVIWVGQFLFGLGGPLQNDTQTSVPVSNDVVEGAKLHVFWGDALLQGLHIGFFIAVGSLVVYWALLNRTTLGYGVKAVGFNPEAARYGGISVARNYFLAMAISGAFAGIAGAIDILGWQFRLSTGDIKASAASGIAFTGIAVALLGRNTAVGTFFAALLFGALLTGTSTRNLDPSIFQPELASNLTLLIQGLVILFIGLDFVILWLLARMRGKRVAI